MAVCTQRGGDVNVRAGCQHHALDGFRLQQDRAGGGILAVIASRAVSAHTSARLIDGSGVYAMPGLWGPHAHLLHGDDTSMDSDAATALTFRITHVRGTLAVFRSNPARFARFVGRSWGQSP